MIFSHRDVVEHTCRPPNSTLIMIWTSIAAPHRPRRTPANSLRPLTAFCQVWVVICAFKPHFGCYHRRYLYDFGMAPHQSDLHTRFNTTRAAANSQGASCALASAFGLRTGMTMAAYAPSKQQKSPFQRPNQQNRALQVS